MLYCNKYHKYLSAQLRDIEKMSRWNMCGPELTYVPYQQQERVAFGRANGALYNYFQPQQFRANISNVHRQPNKISLRRTHNPPSFIEQRVKNRFVTQAPNLYIPQQRYIHNSNNFLFKSQQKKVMSPRVIYTQAPPQIINQQIISQQYYYNPPSPTLIRTVRNVPNPTLNSHRPVPKVTFYHQPVSVARTSNQQVKTKNSFKERTIKKKSLRRTNTMPGYIGQISSRKESEKETKEENTFNQEKIQIINDNNDKNTRSSCPQQKTQPQSHLQIQPQAQACPQPVPPVLPLSLSPIPTHHNPQHTKSLQQLQQQLQDQVPFNLKATQNLNQIQCIKAESMLDEQEEADQFSIVITPVYGKEDEDSDELEERQRQGKNSEWGQFVILLSEDREKEQDKVASTPDTLKSEIAI